MISYNSTVATALYTYICSYKQSVEDSYNEVLLEPVVLCLYLSITILDIVVDLSADRDDMSSTYIVAVEHVTIMTWHSKPLLVVSEVTVRKHKQYSIYISNYNKSRVTTLPNSGQLYQSLEDFKVTKIFFKKSKF